VYYFFENHLIRKSISKVNVFRIPEGGINFTQSTLIFPCFYPLNVSETWGVGINTSMLHLQVIQVEREVYEIFSR